MRRWLKRLVFTVLALLVLAFAATQLFSAQRFAAAIQQAMQQALSREVEVQGEARFVLFPRPGFSVDRVVIHEDPQFSVEPFAYVPTLELGVSIPALLVGRIEAAGIRLVEPSINLMKAPEGGWNVQRFIQDALRPQRGLPGLKVTTGRLNVKFGDVKSIFYLADADLSVEADATNPTRFGVQFEGEPARTDRALRAFGRLSGRGMLEWDAERKTEPRLQLSLSLERSAVSEFVTMLEGRSVGLGGFVSSRARVEGPLSAITIDGTLQLDEFERWGWLLPSTSGWGLTYRGLLNLRDQEFVLGTVEPPSGKAPVACRVRVVEMFARPRWVALWTLRELPLDSLRALLAELAPALPTNLAAGGKVSGVVSMSRNGVHGRVRVQDAVSGDATADQADVLVEGSSLILEPARIAWDKRTATVEGRFDAATGARAVNLQATQMPVKDLSKFGVAADMPLFTGLQGGRWTGQIGYTIAPEADPEWTIDAHVEDFALPVDGLREPVRIASAAVALHGEALALQQMHGRAGEIAFRGSYQSSRRAPLRISVERTSIADIVSLLEPSLHRPGSLLSRTLRRTEPAPEWLRSRRTAGALAIGTLEHGEQTVENLRAAFVWLGPTIQLSDISGTYSSGRLQGALTTQLVTGEPRFQGTVALDAAKWRDGTLDLQAQLRAEGLGPSFTRSLVLEGSFSAKDLDPVNDQDWRTATGCFLYHAPRLELTGVQATIGDQIYIGQGATNPDGRLALDLSNARRTLRIPSLIAPFF
ncbi:MAG: AsmA family protein [Bryobacterales bacterium]|nr:AsmA family protein [Bryobacterales bacterium]